MTEPSTTRRGFFGHVAGAYMAAGALTTSVALADPLRDLITAYYDERNAMNAYPGEIPDSYPTPAFDRLAGEDDLPAPKSRETALQSLRTALKENDESMGMPMISNLIAASLAYFEANA